ncbi:MAG: hypothetical protein CMH57_01575 [Myxococcales bacterium]|nr:hypothetical protein [Myxococcales bacterium]
MLLAGALWLTGCQEWICLLDQNEDGVCEPHGDLIDEGTFAVSPPVRYNAGVAYRAEAADRITLLRTDGARAEVVHVPVAEQPTLLTTTPDRSLLLVLSQEAQSLSVIDPETLEQTIYPLGSPFDRLELSEDGRYAIALYSPNFNSSAIIRNTNEMAVIDLAEPPREEDLEVPLAANPQIVTLRSFGSRPLDVVFAPSFLIRGEERRVALILSENYVTLLELNGFDPREPGRNETAIRFVQNDSDLRLVPLQVTWTEDDPNRDDDMFAFVLVQGSDDIISLNLLPGDEQDLLGRPRIRPSLNQLTGGRQPRSMALFTNSQGQIKLLTANRSSVDLSVIDVATSDVVQVPLDAAVDQVFVYNAVNPDTDVEEPFALLYSTAGLRTVYFVELSTVEGRGTRAVDSLNLDSGVERLELTPDRRRALILHPGQRSFSVLNLERRSFSPVDALAPVSDYQFAGLGDERLVTVFAGEPYIGLTELDNTHPTPVELDLAAVATAVVPETNTILVDHGRSMGAATLLRLDEPSRETSATLWGFGVDDLLQVRNAEAR